MKKEVKTHLFFILLKTCGVEIGNSTTWVGEQKGVNILDSSSRFYCKTPYLLICRETHKNSAKKYLNDDSFLPIMVR